MLQNFYYLVNHVLCYTVVGSEKHGKGFTIVTQTEELTIITCKGYKQHFNAFNFNSVFMSSRINTVSLKL